jgi:hypothetical protein
MAQLQDPRGGGEMVDAGDLKSPGWRVREGSIPSRPIGPRGRSRANLQEVVSLYSGDSRISPLGILLASSVQCTSRFFGFCHFHTLFYSFDSMAIRNAVLVLSLPVLNFPALLATLSREKLSSLLPLLWPYTSY